LSADTPFNDELPKAARTSDEAALATRVECHRERRDRKVSLRTDRRMQGRVDPADVVQEAYLALRGKSPQYGDSRLPSFLWLRLEVGRKLVDLPRSHLGKQMRDAGQEGSLHRGALKRLRDVFPGMAGGSEEIGR
jgi:RNA polymerase sigma-70 factor (ECF subfamily)